MAFFSPLASRALDAPSDSALADIERAEIVSNSKSKYNECA